MTYRVEILGDGNWEPIGNPVEDSDFETRESAEEWITENIEYRVEENASRGDYRIIAI